MRAVVSLDRKILSPLKCDGTIPATGKLREIVAGGLGAVAERFAERPIDIGRELTKSLQCEIGSQRLAIDLGYRLSQSASLGTNFADIVEPNCGQRAIATFGELRSQGDQPGIEILKFPFQGGQSLRIGLEAGIVDSEALELIFERLGIVDFAQKAFQSFLRFYPQGLGFASLSRLGFELLNRGKVHPVTDIGDLSLHLVQSEVVILLDLPRGKFTLEYRIHDSFAGDKLRFETFLP